jgi:alpha-tubulin suppressor-like RCC1 family protein
MIEPPRLGPPHKLSFFNLPSNPVRQVVTVDLSTCVLGDLTGQVSCWGNGGYGLLGSGSTASVYTLAGSSPIQFSQPTITVTQISGMSGHICALFTNKRVRCWGYNGAGQLGQDSTRGWIGYGDADMASIGFVSFSDMTATVSSVSAGGSFSCALFASPLGRIICWGGGTGFAPAPAVPTLPFITFNSTDAALSVSTGMEHVCATFSPGRIRCWGRLGPFNTPRTLAVQSGYISFIDTSPAVQVSAGLSHTCAVFANDKSRCWGWSASSGELGYDSSVGVPVALTPYHNYNLATGKYPYPPPSSPPASVVLVVKKAVISKLLLSLLIAASAVITLSVAGFIFWMVRQAR